MAGRGWESVGDAPSDSSARHRHHSNPSNPPRSARLPDLWQEVEQLKGELEQLRLKVSGQDEEISGLRKDCSKEREAHNATKRRLEETKMELVIVRRQLEVFQGQQVARILESRQAAMQHYRDEYDRQHPQQEGASHREPAGAEALSDEQGGDVPDSGRHWLSVQRVRMLSESSDDSGIQDDKLHCPNCDQQFDLEEPEVFTSHTESCHPGE